MCQVICWVMTAVVACRSRVGASPMSPALSTPPMRGCSWARAEGAVARISSESSATARISMEPSSERFDVRTAFPGQGRQRYFRFRPVLETHHHRLLEHAQRAYLARHAALRATVGLAGGADLGQVLAQLVVGGELVEQTAFEPAAVAEEAAVRERHVLGLGHLDGDRIEILEVGRAAELTAARSDAVHELGGVAGADLPHLDAGVELVREVTDEVAEVHPLLGAEEDGDPAMTRVDLDVHDLELEPAAPRAPAAGLGVLELAIAAIVPLRPLGVRGASQHLAIEPAALEFRQRTLGPPHFAHDGALPRFDDHEVADVQIFHGRLMVLRLQRLAQAHPDQIRQVGLRLGRRGLGSLRDFAHGVLTPPWSSGSAAPRR